MELLTILFLATLVFLLGNSILVVYKLFEIKERKLAQAHDLALVERQAEVNRSQLELDIQKEILAVKALAKETEARSERLETAISVNMGIRMPKR